jgi:hypothetical protein
MRYEADSSRTRLNGLLLGSALLGLACFVRYAGLFFFAGFAGYSCVQALLRRDGKDIQRSLGVALSGSIVSVLLIRNQILAGTWKGGNTKVVHSSIFLVAKETVVSVYHLFFTPDMFSIVGGLPF